MMVLGPARAVEEVQAQLEEAKRVGLGREGHLFARSEVVLREALEEAGIGASISPVSGGFRSLINC